MAEPETIFDALFDTARDLGIGFVSGPLQPPEAGQIWLGKHNLADFLLSRWADRSAAIAIARGGPGDKRLLTGTAVLDDAGLARLEQAAATAGGHVYRGRLALLTPADWLRLHGTTAAQALDAERPPRPSGWQDNPTAAHIAALDTDPVYEAARAAGWPATFANEPVLFLGDEPLYHLLMREDVGRVATLLIGGLEEPEDRRAYGLG
jgi:hypothetical protein